MKNEFKRMVELAGLNEIKINTPGVGIINKWKLSYADDNTIYITPIGKDRPWIDGRIRDTTVTLNTEIKDIEGIRFLKTLGAELNITPKPGPYNTFELTLPEEDLNSIFTK